jgi:hypothetical protein
MGVRAAAVTATIGAATIGAATTWLAVPLLSLALGRSVDERTRARLRATVHVPGPAGVVVPLHRSATPWASVPAPRPAADDVRRVSGVG